MYSIEQLHFFKLKYKNIKVVFELVCHKCFKVIIKLIKPLYLLAMSNKKKLKI